jgi:G3E family GTPase
MEHPVHAGISVATLTWMRPLVRSHFNRAMQALQGDSNLKLLRVKGLLHFEGHKQASAFQGFHQQLFPVETSIDGSADAQSAGGIDAPSSGSAPAAPDQDSMLVLVYRGQASAQLAGLLATLLPGASGSLSPARNFVQ